VSVIAMVRSSEQKMSEAGLHFALVSISDLR
jgi:hypothetical protein